MNQKKIIIIAGPNGAGKTTFARSFLPQEAQCPHFINADLIAAGLSPFHPEKAALRAGRIMIQEMNAMVKKGESFAFETTLSGSNYLHRIKNWQQHGYRIFLLFLLLPSPDIAVTRVAERVSQGGHDIPETVIRRRYFLGLKNFDRLYKTKVDVWFKYNNIKLPPILIERHENS
jgi:predicted ABC-type ATPase